MPVHFRANAEPFSGRARPVAGTLSESIEPILADSQAARMLERELRRYCKGELRGRSVLVSGHRGSGKTTMVDNAIFRLQRESNSAPVLRPLPVYLLGPTLFAEAVKPKPTPKPPRGRQVSVNVAVNGAAPAAGASDDARPDAVLTQGVQALHQAVAKEFSLRLHEHVRNTIGNRRSSAHTADLVELAARFQIELTEAPPEARLLEFWRQAGVVDSGVLFGPGHGRGQQQGLRELVALVGLNYVHQRISGKLSGKDERQFSATRSTETGVTLEPKWVELAKPLAAVFAGTAVATAGAVSNSPALGAGIGLATALASLLMFRLSSTTKTQQERRQDRTFVPDLGSATLHRVMPELFRRLEDAGLAPVFVIDELDKVDDIDDKMEPLMLNLKKLLAEWSFTCVLVDRGYYERLHLREQQEQSAA